MAGPYLSDLSLSHFRCYKRLEVNVEACPVVIFGPNGSGKTSILEAVSLFSPGRGLRQSASADMIREPERLGWKATCQLKSCTTGHEITTYLKGEGSRRTEIDGKPVRQVELGHLMKILWLTPAMDRLWIAAAEERRRFLDRIAMNLLPGHAEAVAGYDRAMRERNRLIRNRSRDMSWYDALEMKMAESGARISDQRLRTVQRLADAFTRNKSKFPVAGLQLGSPDGTFADSTDPENIRTVLLRSREKDFLAGRALCGPHRADLLVEYASKGIPARRCSTGEQKALLISVVLAVARSIAEDFGQSPVLLLDEVAAHLDPGRRDCLFQEILQLESQVWMTGTDASLFDRVLSRSQVLETIGFEGGASVRHCTGAQQR